MSSMAWTRRCGIGLALIGLAGALPAQSVLCVERDGKAAVVRAVHETRPMVLEKSGQLVPGARGERAVLVAAKEYLPLFVSIRELEVKSAYVTLTTEAASGDVNNQFEFRALFESAYALPDVFFVLELQAEAGKYIFYYEVGQLRPRVPRRVSVVVPVGFKIGSGVFKLHLFSQGMELLHSEQPPLMRDRVLDDMVRRRIEGVKEAALRPLLGPAPEYPPALRKKKISGSATVRFRVMPSGAVLDPELVTASAPEFGESAVAAVRLWRFLPKVKEGKPVEGHAELPFAFEPPSDEP